MSSENRGIVCGHILHSVYFSNPRNTYIRTNSTKICKYVCFLTNLSQAALVAVLNAFVSGGLLWLL